MSEKIVQLNEEVIKGQIKELVRGSVEETLNDLLEKEAAELLAVAYKATGVTSFNTQRTSILPPTPGASGSAAPVPSRCRSRRAGVQRANHPA